MILYFHQNYLFQYDFLLLLNLLVFVYKMEVEIKRRLKSINVNSLVMADKAISELLFDQKYQIFPKVRFTEKGSQTYDRLDNDIVPANELGMYTIWIKQGNWIYAEPKEPLEYPDWTIENLSELKNIVREENIE